MMISRSIWWQIIVPLTLFAISGVAHLIGFSLLYKVKCELINQRVILLNISFVEMLLSFFITVNLICGRFFEIQAWCYVSLVSQMWFGMHLKCLMMYLVVDRTLDIYLHLKYAVLFPRERVIKIIAIMWILMFFVAIVHLTFSLYLTGCMTIMHIAVVTYTVFDALICVTTIVSFAYLLSKVRAILKIKSGVTSQNRQQSVKSLKKKLLLPAFMVLSYMIFNLSGAICLCLRHVYGSTELGNSFLFAARTAIALGLLSDSFLYIFMQKQVRKLLRETFLSSCSGDAPIQH